MTKTFGFNEDNELVPVEPAVAYNAPIFPNVQFPADATDILERMNKTYEKLMLPAALLVNPGTDWPWDRTGHGIDQAVAQSQRVLQGVQNSILDSMRVIVDKYAPLTVRRQFRFPRSKKKRIQKKWRRDPCNWKDVRIAFRWVNPDSFFKVTYPDRKEYIQVRPGLEKRNAIMWGIDGI